MAAVKDIVDKMRSPSKEDIALITKAYVFAEEAHKDHSRYSGEPYFVHLFETGKNLAELGMDPQTIAAGLLHDSIEDARVKEETIEKEFGKEILFLIQGVTKLGALKYRGAERHTESLRKLFVAMAEDIRVIIIKLVDRLHNMRTLEHVPEEKQRRIALETLEIYAQLAYRLGIGKLKGELEDLAFPYVYPTEYATVKKLLDEKNLQTIKILEGVRTALLKKLTEEKAPVIHTDYRVKRLYSLYRKLKEKQMDVEKIYDLAALRVIVPTIADCYQVLGIIHGMWQPLPGRIKDYIAFPKPNGYRSLHTTIFTGDGGIAEIQIRTEEMHREAEFGIASHLLYTEGETKAGLYGNLVWLMSLLPGSGLIKKIRGNGDVEPLEKATQAQVPEWIKELANHQGEEPKEFMENLRRDFFEHRVFVFTPKGDVIDLPVDSSPLDFAYAIHSEIGDHTAGAKVNGKMVSLETPLKNGDIVEIVTKHSSKPTRKWLDIVKTLLAKRHIKNLLDEQDEKKVRL